MNHVCYRVPIGNHAIVDDLCYQSHWRQTGISTTVLERDRLWMGNVDRSRICRRICHVKDSLDNVLGAVDSVLGDCWLVLVANEASEAV